MKKYRNPAATAHSHSADAKLPDLTPAPNISITLRSCVLKTAVWRTEFVTTHKHTHRKFSMRKQLSAENNLKRESFTKGNFSKYYEGDPLAKGPYFIFRVSSYKLCKECVEICHVKIRLSIDNTHNAIYYRLILNNKCQIKQICN